MPERNRGKLHKSERETITALFNLNEKIASGEAGPKGLLAAAQHVGFDLLEVAVLDVLPDSGNISAECLGREHHGA